MATHGAARDKTIADLGVRKAFQRKGFGMWAVEGAVYSTGRLPDEHAALYVAHSNAQDIHYTVLSYGTPIAWVLRTGAVIIPDTKYSVTTTHHQNLCRVYL